VKKGAEKVVDKIMKNNPDFSVEQVIKEALKQM
jgi:Holliday junction resolvasome RuvABC DNA-binding subunit